MSFQISDIVVNGQVTAGTIVKSGGTASEFLKANGSVDSSSYITGITSGMVTTALGYTPYNSSNPSGYISSAANWFGSVTTGGVTDWNDVSNTRPGTGYTLLLGSHTNGPGPGEYYHPFNLEYSSKDGTGNVTQFAISYGSPGNKMYMRGRYAGSWSSWIAFLTSSNYNSYSPTLTGGGASGTWGINITGAANNASLLTASGASLTTQAGSGTVRYDYAIANNTTGLFTGSDNSNSILTLNRHPGDYYSQLGFSSNGWLYYRAFSATAINTTLGWRQLLDSSNYTSYALSIGGGTLSAAGDQVLTINKSSGTNWNYIGFSVAGVRKAYFGIDANGYATIGSDVGQIAFAHATSAPSLTVSGALTVNTLNTGDVIDLGYTRNGSVATSAFRGINFHSSADLNYYIAKPAGTWTQPLHIHFYTGIRLRSDHGYGGTQFYNIATALTVATVNDGDNNFRGYYDVIAYASDRRLKENVKPIENALDKISKLTGMTYTWNDLGKQYGWDPGKEREAGVFAQDVQEVLPEAVKIAPFDNDKGASKSGENFLTVKYEKLVPLLIEAIKEQQSQIEQLKDQVNQLKENN